MFRHHSARAVLNPYLGVSGIAQVLAAIGLMSTLFWATPLYPATTDDLIFIHHSCGNNWLSSGLNAALVAKDYIDERNDMYYGSDISPDASRPDSLGSVPGDNTNMNHWVPWFNDYLGNLKNYGCASGVNKIIMFKSCYPISDVTSDGSSPGDPFSSSQTLANYKAVYHNAAGSGVAYTHSSYAYLALEDIFAANPDTLFIPVTAPPLTNSGTSNANAHRARLFNDWLKNDWLSSYNTAHPGLDNVAVFDWFDVLANPDTDSSYPNRLKAVYGGTGGDAHPNSAANLYSTQVFATDSGNFIDAAWTAFTASEPVFLPGDANMDWTVNVADLTLLLNNYNETDMVWANGDFNDDGTVNVADLTALLNNYNKTYGARVVAGTAVPEPSNIAMLAGVALTALLYSGGRSGRRPFRLTVRRGLDIERLP
jgi:hypothetical protein